MLLSLHLGGMLIARNNLEFVQTIKGWLHLFSDKRYEGIILHSWNKDLYKSFYYECFYSKNTTLRKSLNGFTCKIAISSILHLQEVITYIENGSNNFRRKEVVINVPYYKLSRI